MSALDWTERILQFPVRTAAVDDFLRDLRAKGSGDLNAVLTTLNDGRLCRQTVHYWLSCGWIVISPSTPLHALAGPSFSREISLRRFCGGQEDLNAISEEEPSGTYDAETEKSGSDENP